MNDDSNDSNESNIRAPNSIRDIGQQLTEESNIRAPNSIRGYGEELAEELKIRSLSEQKDRERAKQFGDAEELLRTTSVPYRLIKAGFKSLPKDPTQIGSIKENIQHRIRTHTVKSLERAKSQLTNIVSNEFTSTAVNSAVAEVAYSPETSGMAQAYKDMPYAELQKIKSTELAAVSGAGSQAKALTKNVFTARTITDPNNMGSEKAYAGIEQQIEARNKSASIIAAVEVEERRRKSLGEDPRSQETMRFGYQNKATRMAEQEEIRKTGKFNITDPESGQQKSVELKNATQELTNLFKMLAEDTKKLSTASIEEAKTIEEKNKKTTEAIKKTEQALKSNTGGTGGASRSQWASAGASMFNAAGGAIQQIQVQQRLREQGNIAGFANIENQKYDMYKAARGGDVMSQMMLSRWGKAEKFGDELASGQRNANVSYLAGAGLQTATGAFQAREGAVSKLNPGNLIGGGQSAATAEILAGFANTAQGAATTATLGTDMARQISTSEARISGINTSINSDREVLRVPAEQLQEYRDFATSMSISAKGMGQKKGGELINQTLQDRPITAEEARMRSLHGDTEKNLLDQMSGARISPEQMVKMSQVGVQQMGNLFNTNQVITAGNLEKAGMGGTAQENFQRMATLGAAGVNNPKENYLDVLAAATTKGLEDSKALNAVAENTAAMVQGSTGRAMGFDTTAATSRIQLAALNESDPNQAYAVGRAKTVSETIGQIGQDAGLNFASLSSQARLGEIAGGIGGIISKNFSDADLATMRDEKDKKKVMAQLRGRGYNQIESPEDAEKLVNEFIQERFDTTLTGGSTGMGVGIPYVGKFAKIISKRYEKDPNLVNKFADMHEDRDYRADEKGEYTAAEVKTFLERFALTSGLNKMDLRENLQATTGILHKQDPNQKVTDAASGKGGTPLQETLDKLSRDGFAQLSEKANAAVKSLGGLNATLSQLNTLADEAKKHKDTDFTDSAAKSASTFGADTKIFGSAVDRFSKKIDEMLGKKESSSVPNYSGMSPLEKWEALKNSAHGQSEKQVH